MAYIVTRRAVKFCLLRRTILRTVANKAEQSNGEREGADVRDEVGERWIQGETGTTEPWMQRELNLYFKGRKRLAEMMDVDQPDSFSDDDIADALGYLLPTRLTARDARPYFKHPTKIHPERKEAAFDGDGRPLDPGFYTGAPAFHNVLYNIYLQIKALESKFPSPSPSPPPTNWLKREMISNIIAEELSLSQYKEIIKRLNALVAHPNVNSESQKMLQTYQSKASSRSQVDSLRRVLHTNGSAVQTVGRRKSSTAVVQVSHGSGVITVNKRPFLEYFNRAEDRQQVLYPLLLTNSLQQYDIHVCVQGGGLTGQSGATRLAVSKALVALGKEGLEESGLLNRDPRSVERKKPGQKKARKKFTWVKR